MMLSIKVSDIVVRDRKRDTDREKVASIASSITQIGQLQPIVVRSMSNGFYQLIAGEHRLAAIEVLGRGEIDAQVVDLDDLHSELAQIDENLVRNDLTALEQGEHLHRRDEILTALGLRAKAGDNQFGGGETVSPPFTTAKIARELGLSERSAQQKIQIAKNIDPIVRDSLRETPIADSCSQLLKLARLPIEQQAEIVDKIVTGVAESVDEAIEITAEEQRRVFSSDDDLLREATKIRQQRYEERKRQRDVAPEPAPVSDKQPHMYCASADDLPLPDESVDLIITSPPYNLGHSLWTLNGATPRQRGIGYPDDMPEQDYQDWQVSCLREMFRVATQGASLFYNHKVRLRDGSLIHPLDWLRRSDNPWTLRQEIMWDRGSTHNHTSGLFWQEDERIYWFTKGKPELPARPIGMSSVWRFPFEANTHHPAPFPTELPERCIRAVGRPGITVLDPFAGSGTTIAVALRYGYEAIYIDISENYCDLARRLHGWTNESRN